MLFLVSILALRAKYAVFQIITANFLAVAIIAAHRPLRYIIR